MAENSVNYAPMEEYPSSGNDISESASRPASPKEPPDKVDSTEDEEEAEETTELLNDELKQGHRILNELMADSNKSVNWPFMLPVDDGHPETADYYEKIERPMWFNKMKEKFEKQEYDTITQFVADFRLMLENCYRFNGPDHFVSKRGQKLETMMEQKLALLSRDIREKTSIEATQGSDQKDDSAVASLSSRRRTRALVPHDSTALLNHLRAQEVQQQRELKKQQMLWRKQQQEKYHQDMLEWEDKIMEGKGQEMKAMWELPQIGHFLFLCQGPLNIGEVSQFELERCFYMPRESSTLQRIMTALLSTPFQRYKLDKKCFMPYHLWEEKLRVKSRLWYKAFHDHKKDPVKVFEKCGVEAFFFKVLGHKNPLEKKKFHELTVYKRIWLLKALCDHCLETQDSLREAIEAQPVEEQRVYLLGVDADGNTYVHFPQFCGADLRVYRQAYIPQPEFELSVSSPKRKLSSDLDEEFQESSARKLKKRDKSSSKKKKRSRAESRTPPPSRPSHLRQKIKTVLPLPVVNDSSSSDSLSENEADTDSTFNDSLVSDNSTQKKKCPSNRQLDRVVEEGNLSDTSSMDSDSNFVFRRRSSRLNNIKATDESSLDSEILSYRKTRARRNFNFPKQDSKLNNSREEKSKIEAKSNFDDSQDGEETEGYESGGSLSNDSKLKKNKNNYSSDNVEDSNGSFIDRLQEDCRTKNVKEYSGDENGDSVGFDTVPSEIDENSKSNDAETSYPNFKKIRRKDIVDNQLGSDFSGLVKKPEEGSCEAGINGIANREKESCENDNSLFCDISHKASRSAIEEMCLKQDTDRCDMKDRQKLNNNGNEDKFTDVSRTNGVVKEEVKYEYESKIKSAMDQADSESNSQQDVNVNNSSFKGSFSLHLKNELEDTEPCPKPSVTEKHADFKLTSISSNNIKTNCVQGVLPTISKSSEEICSETENDFIDGEGDHLDRMVTESSSLSCDKTESFLEQKFIKLSSASVDIKQEDSVVKKLDEDSLPAEHKVDRLKIEKIDDPDEVPNSQFLGNKFKIKSEEKVEVKSEKLSNSEAEPEVDAIKKEPGGKQERDCCEYDKKTDEISVCEEKIEDTVKEDEESDDEEGLVLGPEIGPFELIAEDVDDLRRLVEQFAEPEIPEEEGRRLKLKLPPRKRCVVSLHQRLQFLLSELEPWEAKLYQATKRARIKMKKEQETWKEEEDAKENSIDWEDDKAETSATESDNENSEREPSRSGTPNYRSTTPNNRSFTPNNRSSTPNIQASENPEDMEIDISLRGRLRKRRIIPNNVEDTMKKRKVVTTSIQSNTTASVVSTENQILQSTNRILFQTTSGSHAVVSGLTTQQLSGFSAQQLSNLRFIKSTQPNVQTASILQPSGAASSHPRILSSKQASHPVIQQLLSQGQTAKMMQQKNNSLVPQAITPGPRWGHKGISVVSSGNSTITGTIQPTSVANNTQYFAANINSLPPAVLQQLIKSNVAKFLPGSKSNSGIVLLSAVPNQQGQGQQVLLNLTNNSVNNSNNTQPNKRETSTSVVIANKSQIISQASGVDIQKTVHSMLAPTTAAATAFASASLIKHPVNGGIIIPSSSCPSTIAKVVNSSQMVSSSKSLLGAVVTQARTLQTNNLQLPSPQQKQIMLLNTNQQKVVSVLPNQAVGALQTVVVPQSSANMATRHIILPQSPVVGNQYQTVLLHKSTPGGIQSLVLPNSQTSEIQNVVLPHSSQNSQVQKFTLPHQNDLEQPDCLERAKIDSTSQNLSVNVPNPIESTSEVDSTVNKSGMPSIQTSHATVISTLQTPNLSLSPNRGVNNSKYASNVTVKALLESRKEHEKVISTEVTQNQYVNIRGTVSGIKVLKLPSKAALDSAVQAVVTEVKTSLPTANIKVPSPVTMPSLQVPRKNVTKTIQSMKGPIPTTPSVLTKIPQSSGQQTLTSEQPKPVSNPVLSQGLQSPKLLIGNPNQLTQNVGSVIPGANCNPRNVLVKVLQPNSPAASQGYVQGYLTSQGIVIPQSNIQSIRPVQKLVAAPTALQNVCSTIQATSSSLSSIASHGSNEKTFSTDIKQNFPTQVKMVPANQMNTPVSSSLIAMQLNSVVTPNAGHLLLTTTASSSLPKNSQQVGVMASIFSMQNSDSVPLRPVQSNIQTSQVQLLQLQQNRMHLASPAFGSLSSNVTGSSGLPTVIDSVNTPIKSNTGSKGTLGNTQIKVTQSQFIQQVTSPVIDPKQPNISNLFGNLAKNTGSLISPQNVQQSLSVNQHLVPQSLVLPSNTGLLSQLGAPMISHGQYVINPNVSTTKLQSAELQGQILLGQGPSSELMKQLAAAQLRNSTSSTLLTTSISMQPNNNRSVLSASNQLLVQLSPSGLSQMKVSTGITPGQPLLLISPQVKSDPLTAGVTNQEKVKTPQPTTCNNTTVHLPLTVGVDFKHAINPVVSVVNPSVSTSLNGTQTQVLYSTSTIMSSRVSPMTAQTGSKPSTSKSQNNLQPNSFSTKTDNTLDVKDIQPNTSTNQKLKQQDLVGTGQKLFLYNIGGQLVTPQGVPVTVEGGVLKVMPSGQSKVNPEALAMMQKSAQQNLTLKIALSQNSSVESSAKAVTSSESKNSNILKHQKSVLEKMTPIASKNDQVQNHVIASASTQKVPSQTSDNGSLASFTGSSSSKQNASALLMQSVNDAIKQNSVKVPHQNASILAVHSKPMKQNISAIQSQNVTMNTSASAGVILTTDRPGKIVIPNTSFISPYKILTSVPSANFINPPTNSTLNSSTLLLGLSSSQNSNVLNAGLVLQDEKNERKANSVQSYTGSNSALCKNSSDTIVPLSISSSQVSMLRLNNHVQSEKTSQVNQIESQQEAALNLLSLANQAFNQ